MSRNSSVFWILYSRRLFGYYRKIEVFAASGVISRMCWDRGSLPTGVVTVHIHVRKFWSVNVKDCVSLHDLFVLQIIWLDLIMMWNSQGGKKMRAVNWSPWPSHERQIEQFESSICELKCWCKQVSSYDDNNDVPVRDANLTSISVDRTAVIRESLLDVGLTESNLLEEISEMRGYLRGRLGLLVSWLSLMQWGRHIYGRCLWLPCGRWAILP